MDGRKSPAFTTEGGNDCPVCTAPARRAMDLREYALFECGDCGSWSSDALLRGAETSFIPAHYFENADLDVPKWNELFRRLEGRRLESVLDVGCGTGAYLAFVKGARPGVRLEGIELDAERADAARAAIPEARVHSGDAAAVLERVKGPFDLITLWDVFEHLPAPVALLRRLAELLTPGGRLYVQTIHERSLVPAVGRWAYNLTGGRLTYPARRTHEAHHLVFFTKDGIRRAANASRLTVESMWFDRLAHGRMDGGSLLTAATAAVLRLENLLGTGLFVNVLLAPAATDSARR